MGRKSAYFLISSLVCLIALFPDAAHAQKYPDKVIRIIVPSGPAGPTDTLARLVAERLSSSLGTTIIDNRAGAGGAIAARLAAAADADGYTLLMGNTAVLATIPAVSKSAGYDPLKSFASVAQVMESYQILVVRPDFPAKTVADLIDYARKNPNKLNYGAVGVGNITHLSGEMLKAKAGIEAVPVQYKSGAESIAALLSGDVQFAIDNVTVVRSLIDEGKLRALAVTSDKRQKAYPDVPTLQEAGVKDYVVTSFFGLVAPSGTPQEIVKQLNQAVNEALSSDALKARLQALGADPMPANSDQFTQLIERELRRWTDTAEKSNIRVD